MSTIQERAMAEGRGDQFVGQKESAAADQPPLAISVSAKFSQVKDIIADAPAPRRPKRVRPMTVEGDLAGELEAWDKASDELWERIE